MAALVCVFPACGFAAVEVLPADFLFFPLLNPPREVSLDGSLLVTRRDLARDFGSTHFEADVAIGRQIPVVRFFSEEEGPSLELGFEVGVFARFYLESTQRELINADFRVGLPVSAARGRWRGRLTLLHVSSHLGDDFIARFESFPRKILRDGVELLVAHVFSLGARAYAGGDFNFHRSPQVEQAVARAGFEFEPSRELPLGLLLPVFGFEGRLDTQGRGTAIGTAGFSLRWLQSTVRLHLRGHYGPSPVGQLRRANETYLGLGLGFLS
ncbi:MAG: DUF1207 domain-containing protein [Myxococcota bacterium]